VAEWFKATVLKTVVGGSSPWVRIPPCPPIALPGASSAIQICDKLPSKTVNIDSSPFYYN
jgi:hypothetical protein